MTTNDIYTRPSHEVDVLVLGAGLTGLTIAYYLIRAGKRVHLIDTASEIGGAMKTHYIEDFVLESGPNTGILSSVELVELIKDLNLEDSLQIANPSAKRRLILKQGRLHALPSGLGSAVCTPLFTFVDKLRILGEPWRSKGTDPNESIASMVRRRLGDSFYDYAVNPFIGGIYAGNPETLVTRYALPKLYALEQGYGSFVRGALALSRTPKTERERQATKEIFSFRGGFSTLIKSLQEHIGPEHIALGVSNTVLMPTTDAWRCSYAQSESKWTELSATRVVSALPAHALRNVLPFVPHDLLARLTNIHYSAVVQVVLAYRDSSGLDFDAFGALMPSIEDQELLGVLNLSACFSGRAPRNGAVLSCFLGGIRSPHLIDTTDEELLSLCLDRMNKYFDFPQAPDIVRIFRHRRAIPQYEASSETRVQAVQELQELYPTLVMAGNGWDGIGIADRVKQAAKIVGKIVAEQKI